MKLNHAGCIVDSCQVAHEISQAAEETEEFHLVELSKALVLELFKESGVSEEKIQKADQLYEDLVGKEAKLYAENVVDKRKFEVKTYDVVLHVKPEKASQIKSRIIDGQKCLLIPMDENENVNVNGIHTTV